LVGENKAGGQKEVWILCYLVWERGKKWYWFLQAVLLNLGYSDTIVLLHSGTWPNHYCFVIHYLVQNTVNNHFSTAVQRNLIKQLFPVICNWSVCKTKTTLN